MFSNMNTQILIRSFKDRIESWEKCADGSIVVKPKRANFDELTIIQEKVFMESKYIFIASTSLTKDIEEKKGKRSKRIRKLGDFSLELVWRRKNIFGKQPFFKESTSSSKRDKNSGSRFNLADFLNSEKELMAKIKKIKPEELSLNLVPTSNLNVSSFVQDGSPSSTPNQFIWLISLSKIIYRSPSYTTIVRTIFDLLDGISGILKKTKL